MKEFSKEQKLEIIYKIIANLDKNEDNFLCHLYKEVVHPNLYYYDILDKAKIEFPEFYEMIIKTYVYLHNKGEYRINITYAQAINSNYNIFAWNVDVIKSYKNPRYTYKLHKLKVLINKILKQ